VAFAGALQFDRLGSLSRGRLFTLPRLNLNKESLRTVELRLLDSCAEIHTTPRATRQQFVYCLCRKE
jgi:hypothetical protein